MKKLIVSLFLSLSLLNIVVSGYSAEYFVKNGGDDNANGLSDANAWATVDKLNTFGAASSFAAGDIIRFKRGDKWRETLGFWVDGTVADPILWTNYGSGDLPIIDGSDIVAEWTADGDNWFNAVYNEPAQVWEDNVRLTYRDYERSEIVDGVGQWGYNSVSGRIIIRCIDDANPNTHLIEVGARHVSVWMSHNNGSNAKDRCAYNILDGICAQKTAGTYSSGTGGSQMIDANGDILIYQIMDSQGDHNIIRNCISRQCGGGRAFDLNEFVLPTVWSANIEFWHARYGMVHNCQVYDGTTVGLNMETLEAAGEYYIIHDNIIHDFYDCTGALNWTGGGGKCCDNIVYNVVGNLMYMNGGQTKISNIYNNLFFNGSRGVRTYNVTGYNSYFYNNIIYDVDTEGLWITVQSENIYIYNNTISVNAGCIGASLASSGGEEVINIVFRNNIIATVDDYAVYLSNSSQGYVGDYNCFYRFDGGNLFYRTSAMGLTDWRTVTSQDAQSIDSNPLIYDDYKIRWNSHCKDTGVTLPSVTHDYRGLLRPQGAGYDMGAMEFGGVCKFNGMTISGLD